MNELHVQHTDSMGRRWTVTVSPLWPSEARFVVETPASIKTDVVHALSVPLVLLQPTLAAAAVIDGTP